MATFSHLAEGLNCQLLQLLLYDLEVQDVYGVLSQAGDVLHHLQRQLFHQRLEDLQNVPGHAVHLRGVELDRPMQLTNQQGCQLIRFLLKHFSSVPDYLSDDLQAGSFLIGAEQAFDGQPIKDDVVSVFKEEAMLGLGIFREIADSLNAKDLYYYITRGEVLIEQILVLTLSINDIYFAFVEKSLVQMLNDVLDHRDL